MIAGKVLSSRVRAQSVATRAVADKKAVGAKIAGFSAVTALVAAQPARADEVDSVVDSVVGAIKATGDFVRAGITTVDAGVKVVKEGVDVAAPVVERAFKTAAPVVEQAVKATSEAASPVLKSALPSLQDAGRALESSGVPTKAIADATSAATSATASVATPLITKFGQFVANSDPVTLAEYALALTAFTYIAPAVLGLLSGSFRGYAGELAPAAALDVLVSEGNVALIDIRTAKEKETSGVPDLPSAATGKCLEVEYAVTEDKKLRGQLRDPNSIEAQITALQVASLKRLNKDTKVVLLDRYGPAARTVAKELNRKGYSKVFIINGGFDGRGGWVQSKLQIKPAANLISGTVLPPPIAKTVFVAAKTRATKSLPAPSKSS